MDQRIALIAMSGKPYHAGHDGLIRLASKECDVVKVFVSLTDRTRKGEIPVFGEDMAEVWVTHIEPTMPRNVYISYGGVPVRKVYEELGIANEHASEDTFVIYSDIDDIEINFGIDKLQKYVGDLWERGNIELRKVPRTSTVNISGTKMRHFLEIDDKKSFISNLPHSIKAKEEVWELLRSRVVALQDPRKLLGDYVTLVSGAKRSSR